MPDCGTFRIHVGEQVAAVVSVLQTEMRRKGIAVSGDAGNGSFSIPIPGGGVIAGTYAASETSIAVEISQRPESISCGDIESKLQDFILDAKASLRNTKIPPESPDPER